MKIIQIDKYIYEIPKEGNMNVPVRIYVSEKLLEKIKQDETLIQAKNVASLPKIQKHMIVMPDAHQGYGMPIGGVAAFSIDGIVSPGMTGFDINCGVRLLKTNLKKEEIKSKLRNLLEVMFINIPPGVGEEGKLRLSYFELDKVLEEGVNWAIEKGYGIEEDKYRIESYGSLDGDASKVSRKAKERGKNQLGTIGSGNHFIEIQYVEKIYDEKIAKIWGLEEGQVTILIHTGSRGLGHQVASDYIDLFLRKFKDIAKKLPDKELIYAEMHTKEANDYLKAMNSAANFAWANRQIITYWVRKSFEEVFKTKWENLGLEILYDVAHNIIKIEDHIVDGKKKTLIIHRKGSTRAFPKGHKELISIYKKTGQPILIPGSMGTASYVLVGTEKAMELSFGSTAHGAGRQMSRREALRKYRGEEVVKKLEKEGIIVRSATWRGVAEEVPEAYKDVDEVVKVSHELGIGKLVARLKPLGVIKG